MFLFHSGLESIEVHLVSMCHIKASVLLAVDGLYYCGSTLVSDVKSYRLRWLYIL